MLDHIEIIGLEVETNIGVHAWEQAIKQKLLLDLKIPTNCNDCQEDLTKTINYEDLCQQVSNYVSSKPFKLIETVANDVAEMVKKNFQLQSILVSVSKPGAIKKAQNIRVSVQR
jgi:7,8-dihydroneopterin aldolase/epimerase/oxygenase